MPKFNRARKIFTLALIFALILSIFWSLPQGIPPASAAPAYSLSVSPSRIQEGLNANLTVSVNGGNANYTYTLQINVTSPDHSSYLRNVTVTTGSTSSGSNKTSFWRDFPSPANTNLTGTYTVAANHTLATSNFTVGLTDKTVYLTSETVSMRAAGYAANESVTVDLKYGGTSTSTFPRTLNATAGGIVPVSWLIPADAGLGIYTVSVTNATVGGTVKTIADIQTLTVEGACEVQVLNLAGQTLANATVEVYNATSNAYLNMAQDTNSTGLVRFVLGAGNYTFKAFWQNVLVGSVMRNITENVSLTLEAKLSNLKLTVQNETGIPIPWVNLNVAYNYTTRVPETIPFSSVFTTDLEGKVVLENVFTSISYRVSASRYGFVFNVTTIQSLPAIAWNNITIVAPIYTMLVKVLDSQGDAAVGLVASVYEWSSGVSEALESKLTDSEGNASFARTVGRYILRFYKDSTFLNEVTVDLTRDQLPVVVKSDVYNIDLRVVVVDYFGQPLPNVSVEFQRKVDSAYETVATKVTSSNGTARFDGVIGGDSLIRVSLGNTLAASQSLYLTASSQDVGFQLGAYVSILGFIADTGVFVTVILILIMLVAFALYLSRGKLSRLTPRRKK